eukprot:1158272-Prymnesium_polylepis.1
MGDRGEGGDARPTMPACGEGTVRDAFRSWDEGDAAGHEKREEFKRQEVKTEESRPVCVSDLGARALRCIRVTDERSHLAALGRPDGGG